MYCRERQRAAYVIYRSDFLGQTVDPSYNEYEKQYQPLQIWNFFLARWYSNGEKQARHDYHLSELPGILYVLSDNGFPIGFIKRLTKTHVLAADL